MTKAIEFKDKTYSAWRNSAQKAGGNNETAQYIIETSFGYVIGWTWRYSPMHEGSRLMFIRNGRKYVRWYDKPLSQRGLTTKAWGFARGIWKA